MSNVTSTQIPTPTTSHQQLYDADFVQWIEQAIQLLRQGRFDELDLENLIEEVEDLGRSQKQALKSNLRVLLMHLLKWQYQPSMRTGNWKGSIRGHRQRIQDAFEDSPSLRNFCTQIFEKVYQQVRSQAADETGLPLKTFPIDCPYTVEQVLAPEFLAD